MNRRRFLLGLSGIIAAPAIVKVASIMPVKALPAPSNVVWLTPDEAAMRWQPLVTVRAFAGKTLLGEGSAPFGEDIDVAIESTGMCDRLVIESYGYSRDLEVGVGPVVSGGTVRWPPLLRRS